MHLSTSHLVSWLTFWVVIASTSNTTFICNSLTRALPSSVFLPETDVYNASISSYPFIQLRLHPFCVVRPKTVHEVTTAINLLRSSKHTKFAVRGGGHNANPGFNNIEDGVTVDMQSMKDVEVGKDVVRVGAGALWQDVYDVVEPRNLTVLGGRIGSVGVAGFLTGGGISFFSPERGWACDYVLNFQVVLASGYIINANATSHPSLFAALKGGQNNFGIVTRFDLRTFPHGPIWGGRIAYAPAADTALVSAYTEFKTQSKYGKYDPYAAGWITFHYNGSTTQFTPSSTMWYTRPSLKPGALGPMTAVGPQVMNGMVTAYAGEMTRNYSLIVRANPRRTIWATTTFHITPTILHHIHTLWKTLVPKICDRYPHANPAAELTFQSLPPPPSLNHSSPNSLGFTSNSTPHKDLVFLQVVFIFDDGSAMAGLENELKAFISQFDRLADEEGVRHEYLYLNFAAAFQDPLAGYGEEAVEGLRGVARKYDPQGVFQKQVIGGFKLFTGNST